ncbi:enamine deaminase RidA (YjgF/YER057c/UK114 family) [Motilibacter rhizosphaerae]|uniref:Enamine deaminase RidA (YjgF/YER057c/UK114 family) n=1 Tax=Motilibacter rhizosphaerae TaxID=598652 RepID=A0A4V2F547_9ACTN|nr:Rid family hydrolase [Motilibacter rhizosphaerae]RZS91559.1 enamine deaminase RidA (YjgF/YER057c/UK114 family) [Motilibacter rhizosphaerae]
MPVSRVPSPSRFAPVIGFSSAVRAGDTVYVAGVSAVDGSGEVVGGADAYAQAAEVLRKIGVALGEAGASLDQVVRTRVYLARADIWEEVGRAHGEAFGSALPASTMVVAELLDPRMLVEIEAVAYVGG